jgi:hypothetical protein
MKISSAAWLLLLPVAMGCNRPALDPTARQVTVTMLPPASMCERVADVRGRAGSQWETHPLALQEGALLTYAMNDLRNNAAAQGANFVHRSEPTLSAPWGRITTAEYAGVAYRCPSSSRDRT